ncbi:Retrovirus-related Pol polyprotein LINE-1 [Gossypium australe]|uniref:Retrovirus-related Pol polyprotein LINE-1 n=1 Tax=Gossypium australe TaxID=47621 RepID=A0A5B6WJR2_9ROSI|nr:Retrovirus-related Pol polyprotein LINE-1 [Gossypium australe]
MTQQDTTVAGSSNSRPIVEVNGGLEAPGAMKQLFEGRPEPGSADLMKDRVELKEVEVEMGCLDVERHSAVVFNNNKNRKNSKIGHSLETIGGSRNAHINKGKGIAKKRNKLLQGQITRFKSNGDQRVSLKDSMQKIVASLTEFSSTNFNSEMTTKTGGQIRKKTFLDRCASRNFIRVFREYNEEHKPDIVCLVEPIVSGDKANLIIGKLGFNHSHRVEAVGFFGGIWVGWKDLIQIKIIKNHPQFIFLSVDNYIPNKSLLILFVYGSPDRSKRKLLWEGLHSVAHKNVNPWLIMGDFNAILSPADKKSPTSIGKRCDFFGNFVDSCDLQDLGFNGPPFTWQRGETLVRLDRALVNDAWMNILPQSLVHHLTRIKDVYGFLGNRKRKLMGSLKNTQKILELSNSTYLANKEREIRDELENVLEHEDLLWRQKARCDWLQFGDRNTNFFHSRTIKRRKFNRITSLRIDNGDWCSDQEKLQNKAVEFFERLYGEVPTNLKNLPKNGFPCIEPSKTTFLDATISNEEIKKALFNMAPLKAPGSDGFHALFFQSQWDILGTDVCQWVKSVFEVNPIEPELNNTLIVLIPKKGNLEDFSHFRPISLYSEQAGFIAGRNIFDNIIIAQEVIHSMRYNRKRRKWMAVKLDLEKAYDRVSWDFINASLIAAEIPLFLRNVIMSAISSSTMQVLWNGVPTQKFQPNRGIRQGCPLSPYLFVLCMEWLGHFIHSRKEVSIWDPIRLSRSGPLVSHLFFADDLVIFCKAQIDQARFLESIISLFCEISGHKISVKKSNIFFSKNTEDETRNQIRQLFGFQEVQNLGKYLGVPL